MVSLMEFRVAVSRNSSQRNVRLCLAARTQLATLSIVFAAAAAAQAPPILNSPYVCANGITYTVTVCKPYRADQWCETTEKQNGNLVTTMDSSWSSMTGRLAGCTNAGNSKPANAAPAPAASTAAQPSAAGSQNLNPAYLKEFPSPAQVMAQVKGSSAQDTAYRQLTALHEFGQMIAAMAGPRMAQNQLTPDETRLLTNYFNAYTALAKSTANPQDAYINKPDFTASLFSIFHMPTAQQLWETGNKITASQQAGQNGQSTSLQASTDPTTVAARRCVELGGSMTQCMGTGIGAGLGALIGIDAGSMTSAMTGAGIARLVVFGTYNAASGLHFSFGDGSVDISPCGTMTRGGHTYSIQPSGSQYTIRIDNQPQPLAMTLGANGKMTGPPTQDVTAQKITGYEVDTNLKTAASTRTPVYGPDTEHCSIGTLSPGPAVAPDQGFMANLSGVLSMLGGAGSDSTTPKQILLAPGPRLVGTYAGAGGLKIQFQDASAVIDCAQAHVMAQYDVSNAAGAVRIAVKNGSAPFNLTLQSNGSLSGAGAAAVNGKLMTGLDGDSNPILTPTSANCTIGNLTAAK
jgi:hypothetical protein